MKVRFLREAAESGKFEKGKPVVVYPDNHSNMLIVRKMPDVVRIPQTVGQLRDQKAFKILGPQKAKITEEEIENWCKCAVRKRPKDVRIITGDPYYITRRTKEQEDWWGCYMFCNLLAYHSDVSYPRNKAPFSCPKPPAPQLKYARYDDERHKAICAFLVTVPKWAYDFCLRIFQGGQYIFTIKPYIHRIIPMKPSSETREITVELEFDWISSAGHVFEQERIYYRDMAFGNVFFYADCVAAVSDEHGPLPSKYSEIGKVRIPRRGYYPGKRDVIKRDFIFYPGKELKRRRIKSP